MALDGGAYGGNQPPDTAVEVLVRLHRLPVLKQIGKKAKLNSGPGKAPGRKARNRILNGMNAADDPHGRFKASVSFLASAAQPCRLGRIVLALQRLKLVRKLNNDVDMRGRTASRPRAPMRASPAVLC
jgi:hypothetical protein